MAASTKRSSIAGLGLWLLAGALLVGAACRPITTGVVPGPPPKREIFNKVGPGDVFEVRVYGEKGLTGSYRVQADGTIIFPLIGKVEVAELTPEQVGFRIAKKLRLGYLRNPQVTIFVKEYNSKTVTVWGQVKKPGVFPYRPHMTIIQAITVSGGFTDMADRDSTIVTRFKEGRKYRLRVKVKSIGEGRAQNFVVRPGDVIWVPRTLM